MPLSPGGTDMEFALSCDLSWSFLILSFEAVNIQYRGQGIMVLRILEHFWANAPKCERHILKDFPGLWKQNQEGESSMIKH